MDTENTLQAYKNMKRNGGSAPSSRKQVPQQEEPITGSMEYLNEVAFGKYVPDENENKGTWNPENEVKRLKQGFSDDQIERSGLPEYLKESFRNNPAIDVSLAEAAMRDVDEKLEKKMGGFGAAKRILETIESKDQKGKQNVVEMKNNDIRPAYAQETTGFVDYGLIKQIVEEVVERKLSEKNVLNESAGKNNASLKLMTLGNNFMFLDSENNVYECKMVYKGKNKKKN